MILTSKVSNLHTNIGIINVDKIVKVDSITYVQLLRNKLLVEFPALAPEIKQMYLEVLQVIVNV